MTGSLCRFCIGSIGVGAGGCSLRMLCSVGYRIDSFCGEASGFGVKPNFSVKSCVRVGLWMVPILCTFEPF